MTRRTGPEQVSTLKVERAPTGALNLNVEGYEALGPLQGFGQLWQKIYQACLSGSDLQPDEIVRVWKADFARFWPNNGRFYVQPRGIVPGSVALISLSNLGVRFLSTGVFVLYADDQSFTFMTPEGHMFASWITLSAYTDEDCTVIQVHLLLRANDPLYEMGMLLRAIPLIENRFWSDTLKALMAHFHASAPVRISSTCIDPQRQWSQVTNIWKNAAIRTVLSVLLAPLRWLRDGVRKQTQKAE